jgi:sugar (pentulose or hexulose) kinase
MLTMSIVAGVDFGTASVRVSIVHSERGQTSSSAAIEGTAFHTRIIFERLQLRRSVARTTPEKVPKSHGFADAGVL